MHETSKGLAPRARRGDFDRYLKGVGIDVGAGDDPLVAPHATIRAWDVADGDAGALRGVSPGSLDFVYSSHCLEHLDELSGALRRWAQVLKPGGHLYLVVPDFELYEKSRWPSRFNDGHRRSFSTTVTRAVTGRDSHWHVDRDLRPLLDSLGLAVVRAEVERAGYDDAQPDAVDQTLTGAQAQICIIARKRLARKLLLVMPGLHGDIILHAPVAAWYAARGYEVIWPTYDEWTYRALFRGLDYVTPVYFKSDRDGIAPRVYGLADSGEHERVLDLWLNTNVGRRYFTPNDESYIVQRYREAEVPLDERWNLRWTADPAREAELYRRVVTEVGLDGKSYALVHDATWQGDSDLAEGARYPVVRFRPVPDFSVFDWRLVIERAAELRCIDSSLANFVDTLSVAQDARVPKTLYLREVRAHASLYRGNWAIHSQQFRKNPNWLAFIDDERVEIPRNRIVEDPPARRGVGRLLVVNGQFETRRVEELPALLAGQRPCINVSRVRRGKFWLTRRSGHRFGATLVRPHETAKDNWWGWWARVDAVPELLDGARGWTADGAQFHVVDRHRLSNVWLLEFDRPPEFDRIANRFALPGAQGASTGDESTPFEAEYATESTSNLPDYDGWRLSNELLTRLTPIVRLRYDADFSGCERPELSDFATYRPEPERYYAPVVNDASRVAVGARALKALEAAHRTGRDRGECDFFPKPDGAFKFTVDADYLARLPLPTEREFYTLAALLGVERVTETYREALRLGLDFGRFGDMVLVRRK